jgi:putative ABC transport system substrate-binding protein
MMLSRRQTLGLLSALPVAIPRPAIARARPRIMMILWRGETEVEQGFRRQLREEGIEAELIVRDAAQDLKRIPAFIAEAKADRPDLIYVWGTPTTLALVGPRGEADPARYVTDIPVVFTMVSAPVAVRLVDASRLSHRNLTGTSHTVPVSDQMKAMLAYRAFARAAVIYNPAEISSVINVKELREEASLRAVTLIEEPVPLVDGAPDASALASLVAGLAARDPQFLYLGPDSFIGGNSPAITAQALKLGLPTFTATEFALKAGTALFGLISPYVVVGQLTARLAARILKGGVPPGSIPVETLERFSLVIRMDIARRLAFYPPMSLLDYAELVG